MRFSEFDEIPPDAGQNFAPLGAHCHVVLYANATNAFHINARIYGNHIPGSKSNGLAAGYPRFFVHFQP